MLHVSSILLLLHKLHKNKSCTGVSCRTMELYGVVFVLRYMDLLWSYISLYNSFMKCMFIMSTFYLIYLMRYEPPVATTYDREKDSFRYEQFLLPPCFLLGILTTHEWTAPELMWTISIR